MNMRRVVGSSVVVAAALALAVPVVAAADKPAMSVKVSGNAMTISGTCPKGGKEAEGWYGKPNGHEPIKTGAMKNNNGNFSITFAGVAPGTYDVVMGCQSASDTAVKRVSVAAKKAVKKTPKGAAKTGGGPFVVWLSR
jgi:hypothetical protein